MPAASSLAPAFDRAPAPRLVATARLSLALQSLVAALSLVPACVKWLCYPHNIGSDDAYIHLRIATNFVHGLGWGINPHQPVNLSTSPAFTLLLAAMERVTTHAIGVTQLISCGAVAVGLVLIFLAARAETGSIGAALFAEAAAAFSVNLWRWNGALMEATFGFAVVAGVMYLLRRGAPESRGRALSAGLLLGIGVLLRPEMGLLVVLALAVHLLRGETEENRWWNSGLLLAGVAVVLAPWGAFAWKQMGTVVPTTFAAKSTTRLMLWNSRIVEQFAESIVESIFFPTLLVVILSLPVIRRAARLPEVRRLPRFFWSEEPDLRAVTQAARRWSALILPAGWVIGLFAFYYLKTPGLQSTGRYILPLLPAEALLLGFAWARLTARISGDRNRLTMAFVSMHVVFAIALNYVFVMPVLRRFEGEYAATMRAAADELAARVATGPNRRVLVVEDIGVLSCAAAGRFQIYDGGALATPTLRGLSLREQIDQVQPAFVLESLAASPSGFGPSYADQLAEVWKRRFRQHSVRKAQPFYYAILYQDTEASRAFLQPGLLTREMH